MMTAEMTPAAPAILRSLDAGAAAAPVSLASRVRRLIQAAAVRHAIRALAARHAATRRAAAVAALDDHIRRDIGLPRREPVRHEAGFWLV
ncbi:hypothetical protein [Plastoroseomonas hellenica]|uniref:hypothetical protein n=1 Tax=Plastoroseomonas hellenica TaxID=2687306 RepID=UPI001BAB1C5D|nr:hypothetical protein [Plastoroseomonas hellenica]MBR0647855.1 hypothetical protein [Plastoroseomonas hellenica]